ncbi:MAG: hypothetical protein KJZ78_27890, partial [Bryobacteraceae bacterium]|nr:hypothetical protein [Bryobacteraceae bacterium]
MLHRGLNILWAAPEDPDTEQGLYRDGLAGHASGKTLFCRLLRHLLGEYPFGTKAQRDGIASNFANLWVVASVRINSVSWVVGRPLTSGGEDFAVQAESIDEVLAGEDPSGGFQEYKKAIAAVAGKADELHPGEGWRHLLPWLSRDQESRFGNLAQWREASSEGDNPQTKSIERHQLMRAMLGLLDLKEPRLRVAIEKAQANLEAGVSRLGRLESELKGKLELAHEGARDVLGKDAPTEVDALQSRLDSMIEVLREGLEELEKRPEKPAVTTAREKLNVAHDRLRDVQQELAQVPGQISEKERRRDGDLLIIRNLKTGNVEDPAREARGWCPNTIQTAISRKCVDQPKVSKESATNIADLEKQAKAAEDEISALKKRQKDLQKQLPALQTAQLNAKMAYDTAFKEATKDATALARRAERSESMKRLFEQSARTDKDLENQKKANLDYEKEIEQNKKNAANLRSDFDDRLKLFSKDFADIIQAVMGAIVEATIAITADGFVPHVTRKGELSGAALDTIKTLAFDLAAIVSSIEGRGEHPRFLIHDGPREGDMARVIYGRFFRYAVELEAAFKSPDDASFQYLITTTTP